MQMRPKCTSAAELLGLVEPEQEPEPPAASSKTPATEVSDTLEARLAFEVPSIRRCLAQACLPDGNPIPALQALLHRLLPAMFAL
jgi:hypothetical protein